MTYEAIETSHQDGSPVEIYDFTRNTVTIGRYTSAERTYAVGGHDYTPWVGGINRGSIATTADEGRNMLLLDVARDFPIAALVHLRPRTGVIGVIARQFHRGDASDIKTIWFGRVVGAKRNQKTGGRTLQCEPRSASQNRNGLRRVCSVNCMHELYGPKCRLTKADWGHVTTITGITGSVYTVAGVVLGMPLPGGMLERTDGDGVVDVAYIEAVTGAALTLDLPIYGATSGDTVTIYPGCDWTMSTCNGVYSNSPNFGGRMDMPEKNPVTGPVFG